MNGKMPGSGFFFERVLMGMEYNGRGPDGGKGGAGKAGELPGAGGGRRGNYPPDSPKIFSASSMVVTLSAW